MVNVGEAAAGVEGVVGLPSPDPPPLHEPRASKSVMQVTCLLIEFIDIFIGVSEAPSGCRLAWTMRPPLVS